MAIWIQSLSWTLIYALLQGIVVYASLWTAFKIMPATSANAKYHLSLSALTVLLLWFAATWWQQFQLLANKNEQTYNIQTRSIALIQQASQVQDIIAKNYGYHSLLSYAKGIFPWLTAFYLVGLSFMLIRLSAGMLQLFALRKSGLAQADEIFDNLLNTLKNKLQFNSSVQLFISAKAYVPMVVGCIKPMILMPAAAMAQLNMEQLESILLHELAHIKRYDYLVNILQTVAETILFFNPFVWMISAIIRREREHCCDDLVLAHTREPLSYATALTALAAYPGQASSFTVAATGHSNHLFHRIKRIMEMKKNPFSYSRMVAAILIITSITCSVLWLTPSFAKTNKGKVTNTATHKPETASATSNDALDPTTSETNQLVTHLMQDRLIDQVKGFTVEKNKDLLYIDGIQQSNEIASKYLSGMKTEQLRVQIFSFKERLQQHPKADIMQLILPMTFSSGCVNYSTGKKPGC